MNLPPRKTLSSNQFDEIKVVVQKRQMKIDIMLKEDTARLRSWPVLRVADGSSIVARGGVGEALLRYTLSIDVTCGIGWHCSRVRGDPCAKGASHL